VAPVDDNRRARLVGSLGAVRARIANACIAAGRDQRSVTMIAVTKTYPVTDIVALATLGVLDIGESRDQEAVAKVAKVAELAGLRADAPADAPIPELRWHFVGRLQSRKSRSVASYAHAVHSLDRAELVTALALGVDRAARPPLDVFVQVSLDGDPARGGATGDTVLSLADEIAGRPQLRLRGVMAVAPMSTDPDQAFRDLAAASARLRAAHPEASAISAGMSADLDAAIAHGSTHVRVGTALLGRRSPVFG
jgi:pyridoxal phosphate enzyme (YggS family)